MYSTLYMVNFPGLNNTIKQRPLEGDSHSANQEIPHLLQRPKVQYRVHKNPSLGPILSQMTVVHLQTF
jgi:hypothetical protein